MSCNTVVSYLNSSCWTVLECSGLVHQMSVTCRLQLTEHAQTMCHPQQPLFKVVLQDDSSPALVLMTCIK